MDKKKKKHQANAKRTLTASCFFLQGPADSPTGLVGLQETLHHRSQEVQCKAPMLCLLGRGGRGDQNEGVRLPHLEHLLKSAQPIRIPIKERTPQQKYWMEFDLLTCSHHRVVANFIDQRLELRRMQNHKRSLPLAPTTPRCHY